MGSTARRRAGPSPAEVPIVFTRTFTRTHRWSIPLLALSVALIATLVDYGRRWV